MSGIIQDIQRATSDNLHQPSLIHAGKLERHHPQRFYTYALLDRIDQPFATFRYFYRPWGKLHLLESIRLSLLSAVLQNV